MAKFIKEEFELAQTYAEHVVSGLTTAVSPFHSVETVKKILLEGGFQELSEGAKWELLPGGKYYTKRNDSTIAAFRIGLGC
jgi:aspartyl aminopeptidase